MAVDKEFKIEGGLIVEGESELGTTATVSGNTVVHAGNATTYAQPPDADLTAIAGLAPADNDVLQRRAGAWTNRTPAELKTDLALAKGDVGLGNVDNTSDASKPVSTATQTALNGKEPTIAAGNTGQYWRGDKLWQTLDKAAVGLGNVDNTSDSNKPVSTAQQGALDLKANLTEAHIASINDFRLSASSTESVPSAFTTTANSIYLHPHKGNRMSLYDGTKWVTLTSSVAVAISVLALAGVVYDVFAYNDAGSIAMELFAWTNYTTRATALTRQDGILVKAGDATRRYLGTLHNSTAGGGIADTAKSLDLWNYYHQVDRRLFFAPAGWTYNSTTIRAQNATTSLAAGARFDICVGMPEVMCFFSIHAGYQIAANGSWGGSLIGVATAAPNTTPSAAFYDSKASRGSAFAAGNSGNRFDLAVPGSDLVGARAWWWMEQILSSATTHTFAANQCWMSATLKA